MAVTVDCATVIIVGVAVMATDATVDVVMDAASIVAGVAASVA